MAFEAREMRPAPKVSHRRAMLVAGLGAIGLAISLPNAYANINETVGTFGFFTCDGIVCYVEGEAKKAGIRLGDRLNLRALAMDDRYGEFISERPPPAGRRVSFPLERGHAKYTTTLTAQRDYAAGLDLLVLLAKKVATITVVVLVAALFLIRPTPLSSSLALFALSLIGVEPYFYAFLPAPAYMGLNITAGLFVAAGTIGFLALALSLSRALRAPLRRSLIALFAIVAVLWAAYKIFVLLGLPASALYTATLGGILCILAAGILILVWTVLCRTTTAGERLTAALLAGAGLALLLLHSYQLVETLSLMHRVPPIQALSGAESLWEFAAMTAFLASALAAYVMVRNRVVDIGLVRSRIFGYGATVIAALATFALVNWAFAPVLAEVPVAIPLEIFAAVAIGYWFSGFRDVSSVLSLAAVDAPVAAMNGRTVDERDALVCALGLAERTRQVTLIAEVRARCAFSAWVSGDDPAFEQHSNALHRALGTRSLRGIKTFSMAASSLESTPEFDPSDLSEWLARASLLRCGRSRDARRAGEHALRAVRYADQSDEPWLRVLTRVALAESVSYTAADRLSEAESIARDSGSLLLADSLTALRSGKRDIGLLQAFVDVRMRKVRPICPAVEIAFFTGEVRVLGRALELPDKERALLFTVAASDGLINGDLLCDALWPESDGDAARNALYVCLHRLRKHAGDPRVVQRLDQGYTLHPGADVDLRRLEAALMAGRADDLEVFGRLLRDGASRRASLGRWFAPFENRLARLLEKIERFFETEETRKATRIS